MKVESDFLVIGSGIAGLSFALQAAKHGSVALITKREITESATNYAQGGIATVFSQDDTFAAHIDDTLVAGAGRRLAGPCGRDVTGGSPTTPSLAALIWASSPIGKVTLIKLRAFCSAVWLCCPMSAMTAALPGCCSIRAMWPAPEGISAGQQFYWRWLWIWRTAWIMWLRWRSACRVLCALRRVTNDLSWRHSCWGSLKPCVIEWPRLDRRQLRLS